MLPAQVGGKYTGGGGCGTREASTRVRGPHKGPMVGPPLLDPACRTLTRCSRKKQSPDYTSLIGAPTSQHQCFGLEKLPSLHRTNWNQAQFLKGGQDFTPLYPNCRRQRNRSMNEVSRNGAEKKERKERDSLQD